MCTTQSQLSRERRALYLAARSSLPLSLVTRLALYSFTLSHTLARACSSLSLSRTAHYTRTCIMDGCKGGRRRGEGEREPVKRDPPSWPLSLHTRVCMYVCVCTYTCIYAYSCLALRAGRTRERPRSMNRLLYGSRAREAKFARHHSERGRADAACVGCVFLRV